MADGMVLLKGFLLVLLVGCSNAVDSDCDYYGKIQPKQTLYVYNPEYPRNYSPGRQCRWIIHCPRGYNLRLDCPVINIPQSPRCSEDHLLVSRSGDPYLTGAHRYCGNKSLSNVKSIENVISISLISPTSSRQRPGGRFSCTVTAQKSAHHSTCSCGYKRTNRIVGGTETGVNEYPMMAGLVNEAKQSIECGAVIITNRAVLTAAHCVSGKPGKITAIVVGEHDVTTDDSPATKLYKIAKVITHPQYNAKNHSNNIAILTTTQDMEFSDRVGPVCLPFKFANQDFAGQTVTALGWGPQSLKGPNSNTLQKVDVEVLSQSSCQNTHPSLSSSQMCTYTPGKDTCKDDSGGSMLYLDPETGRLFSMGIISYAIWCSTEDQVPGIHTRVTPYLNWIKDNTYPSQLCVQ